jgi:hypothetical protein
MKRVKKINLMALGVAGLAAGVLAAAGNLQGAYAAQSTKQVDETVNVSISDNITLVVTPPSASATTCGALAACDPGNIVADPESGAVATGWSDVYVSTNNEDGYTLTISMKCIDGDGAAGCQDTNTNNLVGTALTSDVIAAGTLSAANQWGYRFYSITSAIAALGHDYDIDEDDMTGADNSAAYQAVPTAATAAGTPLTIATTAVPGSDTFRNVFGVKVDSTIQAQTYTNDVTYTASNNL